MPKQINHEENEQISFMKYCRLKKVPMPDDGEMMSVFDIIYHIRNESYEKGTKREITFRMMKAKEAGFKSGTPDLCFPYPTDKYPGLYIEMKRREKSKAKISENQWERIKLLDRLGYMVRICFGWEQAKEVLEDYLK